MCVGDLLHDRETEPDPVGLTAQSMERLEQAGNVARPDHAAGVRDREDGLAGGGVRGEVQPAFGDVVTDGVIDQVRDHWCPCAS